MKEEYQSKHGPDMQPGDVTTAPNQKNKSVVNNRGTKECCLHLIFNKNNKYLKYKFVSIENQLCLYWTSKTYVTQEIHDLMNQSTHRCSPIKGLLT